MPVTGRLETTARAPSCGDLMVEPSEPCHREALAAARGPSRRRHDALSAEGSHAKTSPC